MTEYIERTAVHELVKRIPRYEMFNYDRTESRRGISPDDVDFGVDKMPAAPVVEVRRGRWIDSNKKPVPWDEQNPTSPSGSAYCSECGEWLTGSDEYPVTGLYCPNCGALMREIENGEK